MDPSLGDDAAALTKLIPMTLLTRTSCETPFPRLCKNRGGGFRRCQMEVRPFIMRPQIWPFFTNLTRRETEADKPEKDKEISSIPARS